MSQDLRLGDNLEILPQIEHGTIDCVITDPPYNISKETHFNCEGELGLRKYASFTMDYGEWDKEFDIIKFISLLPPLMKQNANVIIFNSWQNINLISGEMQRNNIIPKRCLVLNKSNPVPVNRNRLFANDVEFAIWGVYNSKGKPSGWTFNRQGTFEKCVMDCVVQQSKLHTTPKDEKVITKLVKILSNENDVVLDPFMGSGTTGISCLKTNRNFIGIEREEKTFEQAKKRIRHFENFKTDIITTVGKNETNSEKKNDKLF